MPSGPNAATGLLSTPEPHRHTVASPTVHTQEKTNEHATPRLGISTGNWLINSNTPQCVVVAAQGLFRGADLGRR